MIRKVIRQGNATLTVSLPIKWAKKFNIDAGKEIYVDEKGNNLLISTEKQKIIQKSKLDLRGLNKFLIRHYMNTIYIRGDDEIEVLFDNNDIEIISSQLSTLIGFAIIRQGKNNCIINDLSGVADINIDNIMRRIFLLILEMAEDSLNAVKNKDNSTFKTIHTRDLNVNKFVYYCLRLLNKKGYKEYEKTSHYLTLILYLEHLGDEFARISRHLNPEKLTKEPIKMLDYIVKMTREYYKLFFKYNKEDANKISDKRYYLRDHIFDIKTKNQEDLKLVFHLRRISEIIHEMLQVQLLVSI